MRVISGQFKGRKLPNADRLALRPTTDFAKESLFNLLRDRISIPNITFLDLCAGTGAISYELLSRGAASGTCVDSSKPSKLYRAKMLEVLGIETVRNIKLDIFKHMAREHEQYDFIFADPPFAMANLNQVPDEVFSSELLKPNGLFVLEHPEEHTFGQHPHFEMHKRYGRVNFTFFR